MSTAGIPPRLAGAVAVVAGATRGAGRGIARALGEAGAIVYFRRARVAALGISDTYANRGLRTFTAANREKSRSADHSSRTP